MKKSLDVHDISEKKSILHELTADTQLAQNASHLFGMSDGRL